MFKVYKFQITFRYIHKCSNMFKVYKFQITFRYIHKCSNMFKVYKFQITFRYIHKCYNMFKVYISFRYIHKFSNMFKVYIQITFRYISDVCFRLVQWQTGFRQCKTYGNWDSTTSIFGYRQLPCLWFQSQDLLTFHDPFDCRCIMLDIEITTKSCIALHLPHKLVTQIFQLPVVFYSYSKLWSCPSECSIQRWIYQLAAWVHPHLL